MVTVEARPDSDSVFPEYEKYMNARANRGSPSLRLDVDGFRKRWAELDDDTCRQAALRFSMDYEKLLQDESDAVAQVVGKMS